MKKRFVFYILLTVLTFWILVGYKNMFANRGKEGKFKLVVISLVLVNLYILNIYCLEIIQETTIKQPKISNP